MADAAPSLGGEASNAEDPPDKDFPTDRASLDGIPEASSFKPIANHLPSADEFKIKPTDFKAAGPSAWQRGAELLRSTQSSASSAATAPAKSGVQIEVRALFTAAAHDSKLQSGSSVLPHRSTFTGGGMLEKLVAARLRDMAISLLSSSPVAVVAIPSEPGSPRFKVVPCIEFKTLPPDGVLLIAVLVTMRGDSADIARLHQETSRKLMWNDRGPDGKPCATELPIRMFPLATDEARSKLQSSGTLLATDGTPMLVSAPNDGTLGELQTALSEALGPKFAGVLQMPHSFTASHNQRINAVARDEGTIRPDSLALSIYELNALTDHDRREARERLAKRALKFRTHVALRTSNLGGRGRQPLIPAALFP